MALRPKRFIKSARLLSGRIGCGRSRSRSLLAELRKKLWLMTRPDSLGSLILDALSCIRIRCDLGILIIPMNCALILIRFRALAGVMFGVLLLRCGHYFRNWAFKAGRKPVDRGECT